MVDNKWKLLSIILFVVICFMIGGRFLGHWAGRYISQQIDELYATVDEPAEFADSAPGKENATEWIVEEEKMLPGRTAPDTNAAVVTDWGNIAGVAPRKKSPDTQEKQIVTEVLAEPTAPKTEIRLNGNETVAANLQASGMADTEQGGQIVMIEAPVRWLVIRNLDEYKAFKKRARGGYPTLDFNKQMLIVLESDSNFPDNIFEIVSAEKQDGALVVSYRVNILGLDKKINSHSVLPVDKTQLPIQLKQVL